MMTTSLRNALALVIGVSIGCMINLSIVTVGPMLIPPPEGVDMSDMDNLSENVKLLAPINFAAPWLAHALGTLVGAFTAAKLAATQKMFFAVGIGFFFLLGGIMMVSMIGGPLWFAVLDLVGAYLPMGLFGGILAGARQSQPA